MFNTITDIIKAMRIVLKERDDQRKHELFTKINTLQEELERTQRDVKVAKFNKEMEEREIKHLQKMKEEKIAIETQKKELDLQEQFNEKTMKLQTEYHQKIVDLIQGEHKKIQDIYTKIMERLPNVNMSITKTVSEGKK